MIPIEIAAALVLAALTWIAHCYREWNGYQGRAEERLLAQDDRLAARQGETLRDVFRFSAPDLVDAYFTLVPSGEASMTYEQLRATASKMSKAPTAAKGLNQLGAAKLIGLSTKSAISDYESGKTQVPMDKLRRLAKEYGWPLALFTEPDPTAVELAQDRMARLARAAIRVADRLSEEEAGAAGLDGDAPLEYAMERRLTGKASTPSAEARRQSRRRASIRDRLTGSGMARRAVAKALASGALVKGPCDVCGSDRTEGHHYLGYSPEHRLDVRWLCKEHHTEAHRPEGVARRRRVEQRLRSVA